ncbi:MAG: hypothetical protein BZ137_09970, partial [Methanosphaera sp. rholeuAM130]
MGGAISFIDGVGVIERNYFENNSAVNGAGIYNTGSYNITNNTFEKNIATNNTDSVIVDLGSNTLIEDNINEYVKPYNNTIYTAGVNVNITNNIFGRINTTVTIIASNTTPQVGSTITINITLTDENNEKLSNRTIILKINNTNYTLNTNTNGTVSKNYKVAYLGAKNITATYPGDDLYNSSSRVIKITPKGKYNTTLTLNISDIAPIVNNTVTISATLKDQNNQKLANQNITLTTDTKNYTVKSNANGTVTQAYKLTKTGLNAITASYNGDSTHHNSTTSNKIMIRNNSSQKINTKLTLKTSNNYPSLTETITFTVTLTDIANNKLANQNITLTIDNKKYTIKSNANGTATKTYTPTKTSTETITAKYNGSNLYYANSTSIKITSGNIYVTRNGTGNGRTNTSPTNITNALKMVNDNEIINMITNTSSDTYNYDIFITEDYVKESTTHFTLIGQKDKNIIINGTYLFTTINVTIKNIIFDGNDSGLIGSTFTLQNCTFKNNSTIVSGNQSIIENNLIANNHETSSQYLPFPLNGTVNILGDNNIVRNNIFENNSARYGGAIYVNGDNVNITGNTFKNNHANEGGAIYDCGSYTLIKNNTFINNTAQKGSAITIPSIYNMETVTVTIPSYTYVTHAMSIFIYSYGTQMGYYYPTSTIEESTQNITGIFMVDSGSNVNITQNIFLSNNATDEGVIYILGDNVSVKENNFTNNHAHDGSAIYLDSTEVNITHIIRSQSAGEYAVFYYPERFSTDLLNEIKAGKYAPQWIYSNGYVQTNYTEGKIVYNTYNTTTRIGNDNSIENNIFRRNDAEAIGTAIINKQEYATITNNINDTRSIYNSTIYNNATNSIISRNIFNDSKTATIITITSNNTKPMINDSVKFTFTLKDESNNILANQKITATINNKNYTLKTNSNGTATQTYAPTAAGVQKITVKYNGNKIYDSKTTSTNITVSKINTKLTLTASNNTPIINNSITFTATLKYKNNDKLSNQSIIFTIDNKNYTVKTNANGTATQSYTPTKIANLTVTAKYSGSTVYAANSSNVKITVKNRINTKITLNISNAAPVVNDTITIRTTLTDANNNKLVNQSITITIDNKNYTLKTDTNGQVSQIHKVTKAATVTVTAKYNGNTIYNASTNSTKITVKEILKSTITITANNTRPRVNDNVKITFTLKDENNKTINNQELKATINGLNITLKTNGNGQATTNYTVNKKDKSINITANYTGNRTQEKTNKNTIIVRYYRADMELLTGSFDTKPG